MVLRPSQPMYQNTSKEQIHEAAKASFGRNVRRARQAAQLSQETLALRIGADQAYVSRIEAGHLNPTLESIAEIAHALEMTAVDLFVK